MKECKLCGKMDESVKVQSIIGVGKTTEICDDCLADVMYEDVLE
jgi:hypothetical protein